MHVTCAVPVYYYKLSLEHPWKFVCEDEMCVCVCCQILWRPSGATTDSQSY